MQARVLVPKMVKNGQDSDFPFESSATSTRKHRNLGNSNVLMARRRIKAILGLISEHTCAIVLQESVRNCLLVLFGSCFPPNSFDKRIVVLSRVGKKQRLSV